MIREQENKPPLYLVTGLVIGLFLGLIAAWVVWPPRVDTVAPNSLSTEYRDQYRLMTALAYASSGDLGRAQARLALLGDNDPVRALTTQAQAVLGNSATQREARALAGLAADFGNFVASQQATAGAVNTPNPDDPTVSTPFAADDGAAYFLSDQDLVCEGAESSPTLRVFVFDANRNPQAGVQLTLRSPDDDVDFSTGLQPQMSPGFAEIVLIPRTQYSLLVRGEQVMGGLQAAACETDDGEAAWGSWVLILNADE
jgi:hypothetical protein